MKKSDVQISYHQGSAGLPMINVKSYLWLDELIARWRVDGHEASGDAGFWAWLESEAADDYDMQAGPDEWAREACWEMAQEYAEEIWPGRRGARRYKKVGGKFVRLGNNKFEMENYTEPKVKIWSAGRQGGWLVVEGLPPVEEWDAIQLGRWAKFTKLIKSLRDEEYPYQFIWNLWVNVYERIREDRRNLYPAPNYEGAIA